MTFSDVCIPTSPPPVLGYRTREPTIRKRRGGGAEDRDPQPHGTLAVRASAVQPVSPQGAVLRGTARSTGSHCPINPERACRGTPVSPACHLFPSSPSSESSIAESHCSPRTASSIFALPLDPGASLPSLVVASQKAELMELWWGDGKLKGSKGKAGMLRSFNVLTQHCLCDGLC